MATRRALSGFLLGLMVGSATLPAAAQDAPEQTPPTGARLTRPPRLVQFVEAPYPESERASGRTAVVVLQLVITAEGRVESATVAESAGAAFDEAALVAARQFVFEPAEIDGAPSAIRILYRYEFVLRQEQPTTAVFDGIVRNREGRAPVAGVVVELDDGQRATTDAQGRFHFDTVQPGNRTVSLSGERLTRIQTQETFEAGKRLDATYDVFLADEDAGEESDDLEIVVQAPALRRQVVSTAVSAEQARRIPGTQGDVLRVVESMPGVARSAAGSGALVVWGAAPEDTRVYVDGVRIPRLYHNGGLRSVVHPDFVRSVELVPGAYGATYGRGLGGLVNVELAPLDDDRARGSVSVDLLDAAASLRAPISDRVHVGAAVRRSLLHDFATGAIEDDIGDYFPLPTYYDAQARLSYAPNARERVELVGLASFDTSDRTALDADPARTTRETRDLSFQRVYAHYRKNLGNGAIVTVIPFGGADQSTLTSRYGAITTRLESDAAVFGLRASYRKKLQPWLEIETGLDAEASAASLTRTGATALPPREGDVRVFGQPPPDQIGADEWNVVSIGVAPYAELDIALFDSRLHVIPGIRLDPYARSVSRRTPVSGDSPDIGLFAEDFAVEPRLAVRYAPTDTLALKAAAGLYHQHPQPEDLSAAFGTPTLSTSSAMHVLLGGALAASDKINVEVTGFYSQSDDLAVRSSLESPLLAEALEADGEGRAYGMQVLLRHEMQNGFFGWISYSLLRSERRDGPDAEWRLFDFDQTHVLTGLAAVDLGAGFEVGLRVRVASGFPRTPVVGAYYDSRRDQFQPFFGDHNSDRIPIFFQTDVRASKRWRIQRSELEVFLEVQNVTNRENAEEVVYNADFSKRDYITSLPILPVLGARWSF